jgi:hypothetical protein
LTVKQEKWFGNINYQQVAQRQLHIKNGKQYIAIAAATTGQKPGGWYIALAFVNTYSFLLILKYVEN